MARNNAWANATLYGVVTTLPDEVFTADRPGFFGSLSATLNHIYEVDLFYLDALEVGGLGRTVYDRAPSQNAQDLFDLQRQADRRFITICDALTPEQLAESRVLMRPDGPTQETVAATILHLVQHQIHNRGQVHTQLSHAGASPPQLDDFYLEYGRVPTAAMFWE